MKNRVRFCVKVEIDDRNVMFRSGLGCSMHAHSIIGCVRVHEYICGYVYVCVLCFISCLDALHACEVVISC